MKREHSTRVDPCRSASAHQLPVVAGIFGPKLLDGDGDGGGVGGSCGAAGTALPPCVVQATSTTNVCAPSYPHRHTLHLSRQ